MLKLYKFANGVKKYWETWDNQDGSHTVDWGELEKKGSSKTVKDSIVKSAIK